MMVLNIDQLHEDICSVLPSNPIAAKHLPSISKDDSRWSVNTEGLLHLDNRIYVPEANDLCL